MRICEAVVACVIVVPPATSRADDAAPPKTVVYVGALLIDGTGAPPRSNAVIVTRGDRVSEVRSAEGFAAPAGAETVEVTGKFVVPGLINSHVHLATLADPPAAHAYLRRELYSGITAVRDMAGDVRLLAELKREASFDEIVSPDIYYSAVMAGPGFFVDPRTHAAAHGLVAGAVPWMQAVTTDTDLRLAVAEARGPGATAIKVYADLSPELVRAITSEAHRQHLRVWAHAAVFPAGPLDVATAGVDVMSHAALLGYQLSQPIPTAYESGAVVNAPKAMHPSAVIDEVLGAMKSRDIVLDATVNIFEQEPSAKWPAGLANYLAAEAYHAGVPISVGTDDDADWTKVDSELDQELELLVHKVGMTPMDAIRSASAIGARTVGEATTMGTVEAGKRANFVVLDRNPITDLDNISSVNLVVKHGVRFPRSLYRPVTPEEMKNAAKP
jgi:imidazolonepropionase-like amidohydrolase